MEVDLIILQKESAVGTIHLGMKQQIEKMFEKLYDNVHDTYFTLNVNGEDACISYKLSAKTPNMTFVKFTSNNTPTKAAKVMDLVVNRLTQGEHRKSWNIVISYDEVSQLYCCKLMPLFGIFERRTRELVYITIIKIFGVEWYEKSFSQSLQNDLLGKAKANKSKLVEGALNELTYEQLKEYLFTPFSNQTISDTLNSELSKDKIGTLSKDELIAIIENCRSVSLWDSFFSKYKQFKDFRDRIERLQPYRNTVMHHKRITQEEYIRVRKELIRVNKHLKEAIQLLENDMYTETKLKDVVSALGNMLSNVLGTSVPKWVEQMKPALASFGKLAIEAAMPQINIPELMPGLNLGQEMAQRFHEVYQIPNAAIQAAAQFASTQKMIASSLPDYSYLDSLSNVVNSQEMHAAYEAIKQANSLKAMLAISEISSISDAINSPSEIALRQLSEQNARLAQLISPPKADVVQNKDVSSGEDDEHTASENDCNSNEQKEDETNNTDQGENVR